MAPPIDLKDTLIAITINMSGIPVNEAGFGRVLFLSPNFVPVSGVTKLYTRETYYNTIYAPTTGDRATGIINTDQLASSITTAFSQNPAPTDLLMGKVTAGWAALETDFAAVRAENDSFYGVVLDLSTVNVANKETYLTTIATAVEALQRFHVGQSEDPDIYGAVTTDIAAALKALSFERTAILFSNLTAGAAPGTIEQPTAIAAACRWLAFNPDEISAPFRAGISGSTRCKITATLLDLSASEINNATNGSYKYANVLQLYGSAAAFINPGKNVVGRAPEEVLSRDWLEARIRSDVATKAVELANQGRKWPLTQEGVAILSGIVGRRLSQGVNAGHFSAFSIGAGLINTTTKTISLPYARATYLDNALQFAITVNFD